ncbi:putative HTH-type transcriptional regulator YjiR [Roseivivax jejudonensis]|uniref:Putative HTH-type transcriptional regulator YjiR n=1 Tax=Roseivivax jejudonensis TaxID=1529041 RepID=A0A1X6Z2W2_9RHOB|nr:PLP-dependent aminotransferase family protein [Roseivivax jejudonensis]SLN38526.1 putative HTH-type transcriptional regulator YjiR [Roseivivax jejudonensis]
MDTILSAYERGGVPGPKYRAVAGAIREAVDTGALGPGDRLPPVRDLAWALGITPGTVARAYALLTEDGTASGEVGRGTFVRDRAAPVAEAPREIRWQQHTAPEETETVSLFSPKVPDCGQVALIHDALARLGEGAPARLLNYPSRAAFRPAREAVVAWLSDTALGPLDADDMVLSHGGQNGIGLVMQAVLRGTRPVVLLEELTYPGFRRMAELLRAEVVAVPMDGDGIVPEALERLTRQHGAQLLCTSPEVHNPTGLFTPLARRQEIAEVARRTGLQILEDDCYRVGAAQEQSYRALLPEHGWYVSSISKSLTPALRIGFAVAPQGRVADLRRVAEHGFFGLATPLADLAADVLGRPETREIAAAVRAEFSRYVRAAVNALGGFEMTWAEDRPYLWLTLPSGWRAGAFCQAAEAEGVQVRSADEFVLRDGAPPHAIRIAINAQVTLASFEAAMGRLRRLLDEPPERIAV